MRTRYITVVAAGLLSSAAFGQSLEQSYGQLCSGDADKASETCATLRKALLDKLTKESWKAKPARSVPAVAQARAEKPLTKAQKAKFAAPWGKWADLVGHSYDAGEALYTYSWKVPYEVMLVEIDSADGHVANELTIDGDAILNNGKYRIEQLSPAEYASIQGEVRARYLFVPGGTDVFREKLVNGEWVADGDVLKRRIVSDARLAEVKSRVLTARMEKTRVVEQQWGVANVLAGKRFLSRVTSGAGEDVLQAFKWTVPGAKFENTGFSVPSGKRLWTDTYVRNSDGTFLMVDDKGRTYRDVQFTPAAFEIRVNGKVTRFASEGDNLLFAQKQNASSSMNQFAYANVTNLSGTDIVKLANERLTARKQAIAQAAAERQRAEAQAAQEAANRKRSDAGWLGALGGAVVGAFAGGNTEQVIGAAMKGVAIASPNSGLAGTFSTMGDSMISGNGAALDNALGGTGIGGIGSLGAIANAGTGGARHTSPEPMPGCDAVGVNASNFKEAALSGGNDSQLKTLCGAAYNYWWMYNNAFKQGYSADDAEITWKEHAKAAAVVNNFWRESRAQ